MTALHLPRPGFAAALACVALVVGCTSTPQFVVAECTCIAQESAAAIATDIDVCVDGANQDPTALAKTACQNLYDTSSAGSNITCTGCSCAETTQGCTPN